MRLNQHGPDRAALLERLVGLSADPSSVELVAALVHGSRATFNVAEAAVLLSVSAKHLYANAAATGEVAPGVSALRSGDRISVPAHQLRSRIGLPDPHRALSVAEPLVIEHLPPWLLKATADLVAHAALMRLESAGVLTLPDCLHEPVQPLTEASHAKP